ncbi:hypothetical protein LI216_12280 [Mediterraneibacter glycyrrhizinilyticus]|uniref:hypothetical protein n=1 Tax=Mediterraneibacter glycyrrhizinilyticus TaxID=342942 RepID=UPI001D078ECD|nr:hypothetical protein [Mediterraneibacter glycyrrhizinilyticus]MCB6310342.1 hypothetical protein [Lachnospiraceae bacterium 210521-DFI.1.109]MCB6427842.1 hypothetical protein [Mediterraneibacter glycyrrhizinilyticus]
MELSLVGDRKTRIKVSIKELENNKWLKSVLDGLKPFKESSRYKYYLIDGDLLNRRKDGE